MTTRSILALITALGACLSGPAAAQTRFTTLYSSTTNGFGELTSPGRVLYAEFTGPNPAGSTCGGVLELQPPSAIGGPWTETVVYSFGGTGDGCGSGWGPVVGAGGALYGSTEMGGAYGGGTLYELQPPAAPGGVWTEGSLYSLGGPSGGFGVPLTDLVLSSGGSFYFVAGGTAYGNLLVRMQPPITPGGAWAPTVLCSLRGLAPLAIPYSLIAGPNGSLYGTAAEGGTAPGQLGEVFQLTPPATPGGSWGQTVIHDFGYGGDYAGTPNSLTVASDGTIYGTTYGYDLSGDQGTGSVFQLTPPASPGGTWTYAVLQDFGSYHLSPGLILRNGNLYGALATNELGNGYIYEMQPPSTPRGAWTTRYLYQWADSETPTIYLMDRNGTLYGTAQTPTGPFYGAIFALATK